MGMLNWAQQLNVNIIKNNVANAHFIRIPFNSLLAGGFCFG